MPPDSDLVYHLLRGSPSVRAWSKYQKTIPEWTLCGIKRKLGEINRTHALASEDAAAVTCRYCKMLMRPLATITRAKPTAPQARSAKAK